MIKFRVIFLIFINILLVLAFFLYYRYFYQPYQPKYSRVIESAPTIKISCSPQCLKLALLTDVHNSWDNLKKSVAIINKEDYDAVVFLGDLTSLGEEDNLNMGKKIFNTLKIPYYFIPGNHDVWSARRFGLAADAYWQAVFPPETAPACRSVNNFNLVFINNSDEQNGLSRENLFSLDTCLESTQSALIFTHEPLYHPVNERVMGQYSASVATQSAQLKDLLCQKKVKLVVAGHLHNFAKYFYACPDGYKLPMFVAGAISNERNFQPPRFLQIRFFEDDSFEEKEIVLSTQK